MVHKNIFEGVFCDAQFIKALDHRRIKNSELCKILIYKNIVNCMTNIKSSTQN